MNTLDAAIHYATENGWACFPICQNGKNPIPENGLYDASKDPKRLRAMWRDNANLAIRTGAESGIVALDIDVKDGKPGRASLEQLQREHGALPVTLTNQTTSGGWHLVFKHPGRVLGSRIGMREGIDFKGDGGYIIAPPSRIDGKPYRWVNEGEAIADAPGWLIEVIANGNGSKLDLAAVHAGLPVGVRNDQLFRYACKLRGDDVPLPVARQQVLERAAACTPPLDPEEALTCLASAWRYEPRQHLTDLGNARRFVIRHGSNARYVPEFGRWMTWEGGRWCFDEDGEAARLAKETALSLYSEANGEKDDGRRAALGKWAGQSENERRLKAMVELAKTEPGVPLRASGLDLERMALGIANGTLDLRSGALRAPRREDYITKRAHVNFQPDADCPTFHAFLRRIFDDRDEVIGFVQRAAGYSMTGDTGEQCLFLLWGSGANGKSTLVNALRDVLGDYAMQTDPAAFMKRERSGPSSDIARLRGARLVSAIETEDGQRLAESLVKQLTGQDTVAACFKYQEFFEFVPAFKIWLAANHKPVIVGDDYAIWRRIHLIPFTVQIPEAERDRSLPGKLRAEASGILNWMLEGCIAWQRDGLQPPDEVREATAEYRREMDLIQDFLDAKCVTTANAQVAATVLYVAYRQWADDTGHRAMSQNKFGRKLTERGIQKVATAKGIQYLGLGLRQEDY